MIDFHSHILPGIDDGSRSVEESLRMLGALKAQGVDTAAATPHYYASHRSPEEFLERRAKAYERLRPALEQGLPDIRLGAEVRYYPGVSRLESLTSLCLEGTSLLLLEMPFGGWSEYMLREVQELARSERVTVLLAHVERYLRELKPTAWDMLLQEGVLMQSNADFFLPFLTRRRAMGLLQSGRIHLLGSDCHDPVNRRPRMDEAAAAIRERLGNEPLREMERLGQTILSGGRP